MIRTAERELTDAGVGESPGVALADTGYWSNEHIGPLRGSERPVAARAHPNHRELFR